MNKDLHRRSYRVPGFSYGSIGAYHVTLCSHERQLIFSSLDAQGSIELFEVGRIIDEEWRKIGELRPGVIVDDYVVMPNHLHGILLFTDGMSEEVQRTFGGSLPDTLSSILSQTKLAVTKRIWQVPSWKNKKIWQPRFHDRIIRDESELNRTRQYIHDNPLQWADDMENPEVVRRLTGRLIRT